MIDVQRYFSYSAVALTAESDDKDTLVLTSAYRELEAQLSEARKEMGRLNEILARERARLETLCNGIKAERKGE